MVNTITGEGEMADFLQGNGGMAHIILAEEGRADTYLGGGRDGKHYSRVGRDRTDTFQEKDGMANTI